MYPLPKKRPLKRLLYDTGKVWGSILAGFLFPDTKKVKLLIFAQGRSGSTLLESLLCSTGYFSKQGEPLGIYNHVLAQPSRFLMGFAKLKKGQNFLCHTKIYHLITPEVTFENPEKFVRTLHRKGWKVIFLERENTARQVISSHIADHRKVWHRVNEKEDHFEFTLDLGEFEKEVVQRLEFLKQENQIVAQIPHLKLSYEQDLLDLDKQAETTAKVLAFVGLPPKPASTHLRKTTERKLSDVLTNYREYKELLHKKGWDRFLD